MLTEYEEELLDRYLYRMAEHGEGTECCECGAVIQDGEDYYDLGGDIYCEACMEGFRKQMESSL